MAEEGDETPNLICSSPPAMWKPVELLALTALQKRGTRIATKMHLFRSMKMGRWYLVYCLCLAFDSLADSLNHTTSYPGLWVRMASCSRIALERLAKDVSSFLTATILLYKDIKIVNIEHLLADQVRFRASDTAWRKKVRTLPVFLQHKLSTDIDAYELALLFDHLHELS